MGVKENVIILIAIIGIFVGIHTAIVMYLEWSCEQADGEWIDYGWGWSSCLFQDVSVNITERITSTSNITEIRTCTRNGVPINCSEIDNYEIESWMRSHGQT